MLMWSLRTMMVLLLLVTAGCAAGKGQYGTATRSTAVDRVFRSGPLPAEYRYFTTASKVSRRRFSVFPGSIRCGPISGPKSIISDQQMLDWRRFFLQSMTWYDDRSHGRMTYDGYRLFDQQGKMVGILYSRYGWIVVEFLPDNGILVHPPQPQVSHHSLREDIPMRQ